MKLKYFLSLLLALLLPATAIAYDFEVDGIYYNVIIGTATAAVTKNPDRYSGEVTIPESVTFDGMTYTVTSIEDFACMGCYGLTGITIPNTVTHIGTWTFAYCSGLTDVSIPNSITNINSGAFAYCSGLTSMTIPNSVISIEDQTFENCRSLTSVSIGNSVTSIGHMAFWGCNSLTSVTIGNSVISIGNEAFENCYALSSVTIPNSVESIGNSAFDWCDSLTNVTIGKSVSSIGKNAFLHCRNLSSLAIPKSVISIGESAFRGCTGLTSITVESGNLKYDSRDNCNALIETSTNTLITGCQNTVIPNSVITIGNDAFSDCSYLASVTIPNSVITIGEGAFFHCSGLSDLIIGNSVTNIMAYAFNGCSSLTSVIIPRSVTAMGSYAFAFCSGVTDVYSYITDPLSVSVESDSFMSNGDYSGRTLHVPQGTAAAYQSDEHWYPYFGQIVDDLKPDVPGDVNCDFVVNIADVNAVINIILGGNGSTSAADVNGDGVANIADINTIIHIILGRPASTHGHEYVDLGLPSGTLWATRNIGADRPEDYGYYFAWGETEPKDYYSWSNYKWCNGSENTLTKYCTDTQCGYVDGKTELDPEDDVAYVNWGTKWRMPTHEQQMELVEECSWTWTTRNGVDGRLVTGPNGNTLFLPSERSSGYYWSRTLNSDFPSWARGLRLDSMYVGWFYGSRCAEHAVPAVRVPQN